MKSKLWVVVCAGALLVLASVAGAHTYDRDDSDYPLRYAAYAVHPLGIVAEYAVLRPIHWIVSQRHLDILFGHDPVPAQEDPTSMEWH